MPAPKPRTTLTPKQAAFLQAYLTNGRNGSAAYRASYSSTCAASTANTEARKLLAHPLISAKVAEVLVDQEQRLEGIKFDTSKQAVAQRLAYYMHKAKSERLQVQAAVELAKLLGYVVERRDVRVVKALADLSDEELAALESEAQRTIGVRTIEHEG